MHTFEDKTFDEWHLVVKDGTVVAEKYWIDIESERGPYPWAGPLEFTKEEASRLIAVLQDARARIGSANLDRLIKSKRQELARLEELKARGVQG